MKTYCIWNPSKTGCDTLEELQTLEANDKAAHSSVIESANIQHLIDCIYWETDVNLKFAELTNEGK